MTDEPPPSDVEDAEPKENNFPPPMDVFRIGVVLECSLAVVAAAMGWLVGFNPTATIVLDFESLPRNFQAVGWGVAAVAPMAILVWLIDRYPLGPLRQFNRLVEERVTPMFAGMTLEQLALLSASAGIGEEILFRGLLQAGLAEWVGGPYAATIGLLAASLAFGLCHYLNATYFLLTTLIGVYLGGLFLWTENLLAPLTAHAVYDFLALVYLVRWKKGGQA